MSSKMLSQYRPGIAPGVRMTAPRDANHGAVVATNADGLHGMVPGKPLVVEHLNHNSWGGTRTRDPGIMSAVL